MDIYRHGSQTGQTGVAEVHKMLPMTLGANIGTTFTALLAALGVLAPETLQIALCALVGWKDGADRVVSGREIH